jgi:hypothetical protein
MDLGLNLIQDGKASSWNANRQVLRGARHAKTPYIGIAEDDTLYTKDHFSRCRPPLDTAAYDMSRWSLFVWEEKPVYSMLGRHVTSAMIAPREVVIKSHTQRMENFPNGYPNDRGGEIGRRRVEKRLGVTRNKLMDFQSTDPIVTLSHPFGLNSRQNPGRRKRHGRMKAYDIPHWGKASDIVDIFNKGYKKC